MAASIGETLVASNESLQEENEQLEADLKKKEYEIEQALNQIKLLKKDNTMRSSSPTPEVSAAEKAGDGSPKKELRNVDEGKCCVGVSKKYAYTHVQVTCVIGNVLGG